MNISFQSDFIHVTYQMRPPNSKMISKSSKQYVSRSYKTWRHETTALTRHQLLDRNDSSLVLFCWFAKVDCSHSCCANWIILSTEEREKETSFQRHTVWRSTSRCITMYREHFLFCWSRGKQFCRNYTSPSKSSDTNKPLQILLVYHSRHFK